MDARLGNLIRVHGKGTVLSSVKHTSVVAEILLTLCGF